MTIHEVEVAAHQQSSSQVNWMELISPLQMNYE
jgi:hypothetical protein